MGVLMGHGDQAPPWIASMAPSAPAGNRACAARALAASRPSGGQGMDVDSAAIQAIDYDADRAKLFVRFTSGERYVYVGVPGEVHRSFVEAPSKGRFFHDAIRDRYPYNRLEN
jgi:lysyl-tRNA synthetase class 2